MKNEAFETDLAVPMHVLQVLCASYDDEPRFRDMIEEWIAKEEVPPFPAFVRETERERKSRKRKYRAEAEEAEQMLQEMGADTSTYIMNNW